VPPAWVPAAIVAEGRKARENLRGESSWEFFASGGPYILGINSDRIASLLRDYDGIALFSMGKNELASVLSDGAHDSSTLEIVHSSITVCGTGTEGACTVVLNIAYHESLIKSLIVAAAARVNDCHDFLVHFGVNGYISYVSHDDISACSGKIADLLTTESFSARS